MKLSIETGKSNDAYGTGARFLEHLCIEFFSEVSRKFMRALSDMKKKHSRTLWLAARAFCASKFVGFRFEVRDTNFESHNSNSNHCNCNWKEKWFECNLVICRLQQRIQLSACSKAGVNAGNSMLNGNFQSAFCPTLGSNCFLRKLFLFARFSNPQPVRSFARSPDRSLKLSERDHQTCFSH